MVQMFDPTIPVLWRRVAVAVVLTWLGVGIPMALYAPKLNDLTTLSMKPPKDSDSEKAWAVFSQYFPEFATASQFAVVIEGPVVWPGNPLVANFSSFVETDAAHYRDAHQDWPSEIVVCSAGVYTDSCGDYIVPIEHKYQQYDEQYFVSKDRKLTFIMIAFTDPTGKSDITPFSADFLNSYANHLEDHVVTQFGKLQSQYKMSGYTARVTGILMLGQDGATGSVKDLAKTDMIVMPTAFIILTYYIRSLRLLIIPIITLGLSIGGAFLFVYPVAKYSSMTFLTFVPQFMMSTCLAISLDYNLFILTRFKEGNDLGFTVFDTLTNIMRHTCGHTIAISGTLITLAWLGQMIIPCDPLVAQGLSTAIATLNCVLVNVTFTPAILCIFPSFFKVQTSLAEWKACILKCFGKKSSSSYDAISPSDDEDGSEDDGAPINENAVVNGRGSRCVLYCGETSTEFYKEGRDGKTVQELREEAKKAQEADIWFRIAKMAQRYPVVVILVVLAMGAPFYSRVPEITTSTDPFEFVPRNAQSVTAWRDMSKEFPPGALIPFYVILEFTRDVRSADPLAPLGSPASSEGALTTPVGYAMMDDLAASMVKDTLLAEYTSNDTAYGVLTGMMQAPKTNYTWECSPPGVDPASWDGRITWDYLYSNTSGLLVPWSDFRKDTQLQCQGAYLAFRKVMMSSDDVATFIAMVSPFQPLGSISSRWMDQFADVQGKMEQKYTTQWAPLGEASPASGRLGVADDGTEGEGEGEGVAGLEGGLPGQEERYTLKVFLAGGNTIPRDYNRIIDRWTMPMLVGLIAFVSVVIFIAFRSLVIPLRMALTITYTVSTTFGFAYYVYQTSAFHWLFPYLKDFDGDSFMWIVPTCAMAITACLGMDYDVFLTARIYEYRFQLKYTTAGSIIKGLTKTGSIITGAGIIMCVAFFGLILSDVVALNQFGVILCFSVMLDTFIVRSVFVPATMFLVGEANWWPRSVSPGLYDEDDFVDDIPDLHEVPADTST